MSKQARHFGIDWRRHRIAHAAVLGLIVGGLVNMGSVALDYTRPADSWWLMGGVLLASLLVGAALQARERLRERGE